MESSEYNKLNRLRDTEDRQTAVRGEGLEGLEGAGWGRRQIRKRNRRGTDKSMEITRGKGAGVGEAEGGKGAIDGDGRRLALGGGHTRRYADDKLQSCPPKTCITLLNDVTPIHSITKLKHGKVQHVLRRQAQELKMTL